MNARNNQGFTPLHRSSSLRSPDVARVLLKHGADPNAKTPSKNTPLHIAVEYGTPTSNLRLKKLEFSVDLIFQVDLTHRQRF